MRKTFAAAEIGLVVFLLVRPPVPAAPATEGPPDLTQGGARDDRHDWTLGPTGARGWIWGRDLETREARQILVTKVEAGSPADGVLELGDVIVGVAGRHFDDDARQAFGRAITEAEKSGNGGRLRLRRWRQGEEAEVQLQLMVLGGYSDTAPYDCPKSRRILENGIRYLAVHGLGDGIVADLNALAVLAAGQPELLGEVRAQARKVGPTDLRLRLQPGMCAWEWGYHNLFLCEYYLATGDESVRPAIREYATTMAAGQSAVGTWGHGMALPADDGRLGGYGAINQAGLVCFLSLILAQTCGVTDDVVHRAVARSRAFFSFYANKGSVPYGDHPPWWDGHDNNGKNSLAAVAFDLLGDREATRFFSRMATASYDEREYGHTGNFFSYLWGPPGVARAGPQAVAAYLQEQRWFLDLARRWDGGFVYQGGAGADDSYTNWDMTGVFLLACALPLRRLYITGKGVSQENALTGQDLRAVIEDGRGFRYRHMKDCYAGRSVDALLTGLGSWSPTVRYRAASALAMVPDDVVPALVRMLEGDSLNARYGACQALEYQKDRAAPAVDALIRLLPHRDSWLQVRASYALAGIGAPARRAVPALLKLALTETADPRQMTPRYLCLALFLGGYADNAPRRGLLADSLDGVDRDLLLPTLRRMLTLEDGLARSQVASVFGRLTDEELETLWPDILRAVEKPAPSGEMFADGIRVAGLHLLAKHRIREGMQAALLYARTQNPWASQDRMWEIMKALKSYGAAAKELLPALNDLRTACRNESDFPEDCRRKKTAAVEDAIRFIETAQELPDLRSLVRTNPKAE